MEPNAKIVITVRNGLIEDIFGNFGQVEIEIIDFDAQNEDDDAVLRQAEIDLNNKVKAGVLEQLY